ncbi:hypothetical protein BKA56DRAFT_585808 [Ilyonectria sp. MPI-CAGE-AT-0026]|nr:hypothetical protein BKA56DRAFT_585808 [Ilyonectria sp. MPI-CAGE-AT-0026]
MKTSSYTANNEDPSKRHICTYYGRGFRQPEHLQHHTRIRTFTSCMISMSALLYRVGHH